MMSSTISQKISGYLKDRFPLHHMLPLSLVFGLACSHPFSLGSWVLASAGLFLYLLELRLLDEFKDDAHDRTFYPDRPVQRGLVRLQELTPVLIACIFVQTVVVFAFGANMLMFLFVQLYTFFMSREFFAKPWMSRHFTINIILHELITPVLFIFLFSYSTSEISAETIIAAFLCGIGFFLLEMGRKLKPREKTGRANDTYVQRYGNRRVAEIIAVLLLLSVVLSVPVYKNTAFMIPVIAYLPAAGFLLVKYSSGEWIRISRFLFAGLVVFVFLNLILLSVSRLNPA